MYQISLASPAATWRMGPAGPSGLPAAVAAGFAATGTIGATVPGCVHDDLLAASLIPDPYLGVDEHTDSWIGHRAWHYETCLPVVPQGYERVDLVTDGLDTVADITIDGCPVGASRNQHRRYRFDVTSVIGAGGSDTDGRTQAGHQLSIDFADIYAEAERCRAQIGDYPASYDEPFNYTRKMASNFGWDWGPTVVTAGIWQDIRLEAWNTARLAEVRAQPQLDHPDGSHGMVRVDVVVERTRQGVDLPLEINARLWDDAGRVVAQGQFILPGGALTARIDLDAGEVERWWPWDMGSQPVYRLEVTLASTGRANPTIELDSSRSHALDTDPLDQWEHTIGFRSIELSAQADKIGRSFTIVVAGQPVFARGFNWIPNDLLVHRVSADDYRARLLDAKDAGANLIRVWGGGIFEKDAFYDICDELGLLVWQDCLFACAAYPETAEFTAEVQAEVRDNAVRLMSHPSLAIWNGCNENLWGHADWGWRQVLGDRGWGAQFYFDTIPAVLAEVDPTHPYWPGSPYSGDDTHHPNDPAFGCSHSWDVWNNVDYWHYLDTRPRFVSEFGWCGPAAYSTLRDAVGEKHMQMWDPVYLWHYKSQDGEQKLRRAVSDGFSAPADFDTWHYAQQVQQARAVRLGIDWWRSAWPDCAGAVVWQLNDCWPVTSWAAVDSAGVRKPVWYAIRQAFAPQVAAVFPVGDHYQLSLANSAPTDWEAEPVVRRVSLTGQTRASWTRQVHVPAGQVIHIDLPDQIVPGPNTGVAPTLEASESPCDPDSTPCDPYSTPTASSANTQSSEPEPSTATVSQSTSAPQPATEPPGPAAGAADSTRIHRFMATTQPWQSVNSGLATDEIVVVDAGTSVDAGTLVADAGTVMADEGTRRILARPDKELASIPARYQVRVDSDADGGQVTVVAETVVRDLLLQADRLGAKATHDLVTLLPGESHTWTVTGLGRPLTAADCEAPVLLSAADAEVRARA